MSEKKISSVKNDKLEAERDAFKDQAEETETVILPCPIHTIEIKGSVTI